jgi:hypothetical protein
MNEKNPGAVMGIIRNAQGDIEKGAIVRLVRLAVGLNASLPIYRSNPGPSNREIAMQKIMKPNTTPFRPSSMFVYSDKNGRYIIPFTWDKAEIGGFLGTVTAEVHAIHKNQPKSGKGKSRFYISPNPQSLANTLPMSLDVTDLADMKGFKLHAVFSKYLTPKLSNIDMVGAAYCNIWLP